MLFYSIGLFIGGSVLTCFGSYSSLEKQILLSPLILVVAATAVLPIVILVAPRSIISLRTAISLSLVCVFISALSLGFVRAQALIESPRPLSVLKIGEKSKEAETEIRVRIMLTGERGVLVFDPIAQSFGLLPWDFIKRIDWKISSLRDSR